MAWVRISDDFYDHSKMADLSPVAVGWWVTALAHCNRNLSDGRIGRSAAARLIDYTGLYAGDEPREPVTWAHVSAELADAGVIEQDGNGWRIVDYLDYQPSADRVKADRQAAAERQQAWRDRKRTPSTTKPAPTERPAPRKPATTDTEGPDDFATFWQAYPRKVGKAAAVKAWAKARRTTEADTITTGLGNAVQVWRATDTEPRFIPHPATWLNEGRWADEQALPDMPATGPARPSVTAELCDGADCPGVRHEWTRGRDRLVCLGHAA